MGVALSIPPGAHTPVTLRSAKASKKPRRLVTSEASSAQRPSRDPAQGSPETLPKAPHFRTWLGFCLEEGAVLAALGLQGFDAISSWTGDIRRKDSLGTLEVKVRGRASGGKGHSRTGKKLQRALMERWRK